MKLQRKLTVAGLILALIAVVAFAFAMREGNGRGTQNRLVVTPGGQITLLPRDPTTFTVVATLDWTNAGTSTNRDPRAH